MKTVQEMHNIVAELCSFIINNCDEDFFVHYSCVSEKDINRSKNVIKEYVPELFDSHEDVHIFELTELTETFIENLKKAASDLENSHDYSCVMNLTVMLDEAMEKILNHEFEQFIGMDYTTVLNTNRETTGVGLLPRCFCAWERKHRLSHCYNRMDNFLSNFLLMENSILGELVDIHHFLEPEIFPNFKANNSIKVAATPLRLEPDFVFEKCDNGKMYYYEIKYNEETNDKNNNLIWSKIVAAAKNNSDIMVFPEGISNSETVDFIQGKIRALSKEEQANLPGLIILPSLCKGNDNTATILGRDGEILFRQKKQNPVRWMMSGVPYLENITPSRVINILHYEGIGRFAILICKDFLTTKYMEQLMRCFKLTMIIVPSFSTGSYDFQQSFDICAHDDCNVVWINSCAAIEPGKESNFKNIGYVRKRISRFDDESQKLCAMPICKGAFEGKCDHSCIFFEEIRGV
ncbi:MAG: hypothetical protein K6D02_00010 [Lachnospiraceae bacterium]|nr:hypothetical protein [Lachnospiraceae bacterium]